MEQILEKNVDCFLLKIHTRAFAFATYRLKDNEVAKDLIQDTMIGFIKAVHGHKEEAWTNLFYKILTRRIIDYKRKEQGRKKLMDIQLFSSLNELLDETTTIIPNTYWESQHASTELTTSDNVQSHINVLDMLKRFDSVLDALPARQRRAYLLRQWQSLSIKEVARMMKCSESSVKALTFRAMLTLREQFEEWEK